MDVGLPDATSENRAESPLYGELYPITKPAYPVPTIQYMQYNPNMSKNASWAHKPILIKSIIITILQLSPNNSIVDYTIILYKHILKSTILIHVMSKNHQATNRLLQNGLSMGSTPFVTTSWVPFRWVPLIGYPHSH